MIAASLIIGLAFGAFRHVPNQVRTKGRIIDLEFEKDEIDYTSGSAVALYHAGNKQYVIKTDNRSRSYNKGGTVIVCYNRLRPEEAFIKPKASLYIGMAVFFIAGIFVIIKTYFL